MIVALPVDPHSIGLLPTYVPTSLRVQGARGPKTIRLTQTPVFGHGPGRKPLFALGPARLSVHMPCSGHRPSQAAQVSGVSPSEVASRLGPLGSLKSRTPLNPPPTWIHGLWELQAGSGHHFIRTRSPQPLKLCFKATSIRLLQTLFPVA